MANNLLPEMSMISNWTKTVLAALLLAIIPSVCLAQIEPLPALAPQTVGSPSQAPPTVTTVWAAAQAALPGQILYDGSVVGNNGIGIAPWGGGAASEDDTHSIQTGNHSILIESPNYYQGGVITFAQPVALGDTGDKTKYLELTLLLSPDPKYPATPQASQDTTTPGYAPGMFNPNAAGQKFDNSSKGLFKLMQGPPPGWRPPTGPPPGWRPPTGPMGGAGNFPRGPIPNNSNNNNSVGVPQTDDNPPPPLPAKSVHILLTFADGTQTDIDRTLPAVDDNQDWFSIFVPIAKLSIADSGSQPKLTALSLATNNPTLINVGQVRLVTDTSPLQASAGGEKDISVNELAVFKAQATSGASTLKYQWDFDTQANFVAESEGERVTHAYPASGNYVVTLVVTDVDGIKAPVITTTTVHVEQ
jgi:hypothetical protein